MRRLLQVIRVLMLTGGVCLGLVGPPVCPAMGGKPAAGGMMTAVRPSVAAARATAEAGAADPIGYAELAQRA